MKVERIRNRAQLSRLLSENHLHITPETFRPNVQKIRERRRRQAPGVTQAKANYWWDRPIEKLLSVSATTSRSGSLEQTNLQNGIGLVG